MIAIIEQKQTKLKTKVMKVKIISTVPKVKEVNVNYPIYCYTQNDDEGIETFVKITKLKYFQIEFNRGGIEFHYWLKKSDEISEYWYNNQTSSDHYNDGLIAAKDFVLEF